MDVYIFCVDYLGKKNHHLPAPECAARHEFFVKEIRRLSRM